MPVTTVVTDWGEAMMTSLSGAMMMLFGAIPKILGFAIILIVGWFIAGLIERGVAALLRTVRFNELAQKAGFADFVKKMGVNTDASGFLAGIVKWGVRLIVLVVAFDALGLPAVSDVLRQLLLWLPNLAVALVVLVIGGLLAGALRDLVRGATAQAGFERPDVVARVAFVAVWAFAIVVAVNQIGIAATLVNTLFMAIVGAAALALGLAFGLGGRDVAAQIVRGWYERGQAASGKIEVAAEAAGRQAQGAMSSMSQPAAPPTPTAGSTQYPRGNPGFESR